MHVTYGFVYYFCLLMITATLGLSVFVLRPLRKKVFDYLKKIKLMDHFVVQSIVYISFFVISVILIDAVWTYYGLKQNLERGNSLYMQAPLTWKTSRWTTSTWYGPNTNKTTCNCIETTASFTCPSATSCWPARPCSSPSSSIASVLPSPNWTTSRTKSRRASSNQLRKNSRPTSRAKKSSPHETWLYDTLFIDTKICKMLLLELSLGYACSFCTTFDTNFTD